MESLSLENLPADPPVVGSASDTELCIDLSEPVSERLPSDQFTRSTQSDHLLEQPEQPEQLDRNAFVFGFTPQAELWNGRLAMLIVSTFLVLRVIWLRVIWC